MKYKKDPSLSLSEKIARVLERLFEATNGGKVCHPGALEDQEESMSDEDY